MMKEAQPLSATHTDKPVRLRSRIFSARVMHARIDPVGHQFTYPVYTYCFDLDELADIPKVISWFGYNTFRPISMYDRDYLRDESPTSAGKSIKEGLLVELRAQGCVEHIQRVELITSARFLHYAFNPVSFYFCYGTDGKIRYHVAEINNTYGERHIYVLGSPAAPAVPSAGSSHSQAKHYRTGKDFFVSPFFNVEGEYDFYFGDLSAALDVRINVVKNGKTVFVSRISGEGAELTPRNIARTIVRFPCSVLLTIPRIYWQAQVLRFVKKLPMLDKPEPMSAMTIVRAGPTMFQRLAMSVCRKFLASLRYGHLTLCFPDGHQETFGDPHAEERGQMRFTNYRLFPRIVRDGGLGLGEGYVAGDWEADDLAAVLRILLQNLELDTERKLNLLWPIRLLHRLRHSRRANSRVMAKENIHVHYDIGNNLFETFLDPTMMYSSAIFRSADDTLEAAQCRKIQTLIEKARLQPSDHVLEIGTGWGTFSLTAARQIGCRITTVTNSEEHYAHTVERVRREGLQRLIEVRKHDYRETEGSFDKIVSIEMVEAVGREYLPVFFKKCDELLKPNGLAVLQVITMLDQWYGEYCKRMDWIQKYVFPGSHLPSLTELSKVLTSKTSFVIEHLENIAPHYALTLAEWRRRFNLNRDRLLKMGYDGRFQRIFNYYLASCEAEFGTRLLNVVQVVLTRANNQSLLREDRELCAPPMEQLLVGGRRGGARLAGAGR